MSPMCRAHRTRPRAPPGAWRPGSLVLGLSHEITSRSFALGRRTEHERSIPPGNRQVERAPLGLRPRTRGKNTRPDATAEHRPSRHGRGDREPRPRGRPRLQPHRAQPRPRLVGPGQPQQIEGDEVSRPLGSGPGAPGGPAVGEGPSDQAAGRPGRLPHSLPTVRTARSCAPHRTRRRVGRSGCRARTSPRAAGAPGAGPAAGRGSRAGATRPRSGAGHRGREAAPGGGRAAAGRAARHRPVPAASGRRTREATGQEGRPEGPRPHPGR